MLRKSVLGGLLAFALGMCRPLTATTLNTGLNGATGGMLSAPPGSDFAEAPARPVNPSASIPETRALMLLGTGLLGVRRVLRRKSSR
jgi:hypothetical protein